MQITFWATSTYSSRVHEESVTVDVPPAPPASAEDAREDWINEHLVVHTGDGLGRGERAVYEVEVTACPYQPDLVGLKYRAEG